MAQPKEEFSREEICSAIRDGHFLVADIENLSLFSRDEIQKFLDQIAELGIRKIRVFSGKTDDMPEIPDSLTVEFLSSSCSEEECPFAERPCFRPMYSCLIRENGDVVPCAGLNIPMGNIREKSLPDILSESMIGNYLRHYREHIKGPCATCIQSEHCAGLRCTAYRMTGDYLASDPACPLNQDKLDRIRILPQSSDGLLPHDRPMLFVGDLIELGEKRGKTKSVVREDNPFLNRQGVLAREAFVEYAAQTAALLDSFELDGKVSPGLLIEVQHFQVKENAHAGDTITVDLKKEFDLDIWHGISVRIWVNDTFAAEGELKLCIYK